MNRVLICALAVALAGCASHPEYIEGRPRDLDQIEVTVFEHPNRFETNMACIGKGGWGRGIALFLLNGPFMVLSYDGCAMVWPDRCEVYITEGDTKTLNHELHHCMGYKHREEHVNGYEERDP